MAENASQATSGSKHVPARAAARVKTPLPADDVTLRFLTSDQYDPAVIREAWEFCCASVSGKIRFSGEPFADHCAEVAAIVATICPKPDAVIASLLHDVVLHGSSTIEEVEDAFGEHVAKVVAGVTNLGRIPWTAEPHSAPQQLVDRQKLLGNFILSIINDVDVAIIKLADRLHHMSTLDALSDDARKRTCLQTLLVYAPLAGRLGMAKIKAELEDAAFRHLQPYDYSLISKEINTKSPEREAYTETVKAELAQTLRTAGVKAEITGRAKHIYSIYRKMERKNYGLDRILDVVALRVIVSSIDDCYSALGAINDRWPSVVHEYVDYIQRPKDNGYQSLHVVARGPQERLIEIQIRTQQMHDVAENGVASHWRYKEGIGKDELTSQRASMLRNLVRWRLDVEKTSSKWLSDSQGFLPEMIYVLTPEGQPIDLPVGATPIDAAFKIHTELGYKCSGARVNGTIAPLDQVLQMGDVVEILEDGRYGGPSRDWLNPKSNFIASDLARDKIREWFRLHDIQTTILKGERILEEEMRRFGLRPRVTYLARLLDRYGSSDESQFYVDVAEGRLERSKLASWIRCELAPKIIADVRFPVSSRPVSVLDISSMEFHIAGCCNPSNENAIVGYVRSGARGMSVHRIDCPEVKLLDPSRLIPVHWGSSSERKELIPVVWVTCSRDINLRRAVLDVAAESIFVRSMTASVDVDSATMMFQIAIDVPSHRQLNQFMAILRGFRGVTSVTCRFVPRGEGRQTLSLETYSGRDHLPFAGT